MYNYFCTVLIRCNVISNIYQFNSIVEYIRLCSTNFFEMCSENVKNWCSCVFSALGVVLGLGAFVVFFGIFKNYEAGIWSIMSAVVAAVLLHLSCLALRGRLDSWHTPDSLRSIAWLGGINVVVGLSGLVWNVVRTAVYHTPVLPVEDSSAIAAVWALMVAKWGLLVALSGRRYSLRLLEGEGTPLLPPAARARPRSPPPRGGGGGDVTGGPAVLRWTSSDAYFVHD
ncbi:uncharacterized protein LOC134541088 [Bacillus rossius redtenbacheri]|uniref:uncharacterized protein LOC134541088 n=1 Tax=Bacillus rossius redtenbacheri TaxID=93214 RepID=UPI002FDD66B0